MNTPVTRRRLLGASAAGSTLALLGCASVSTEKPIARVVVVGAGYGGATAAKYIRKWDPRIEVLLVERNERFVSCPISNLVLGGVKRLEDITLAYDGLARYGIRLVRDEATAIDLDRRQVRLARGEPLAWDRLLVAPGIDFDYDAVPGVLAAEQAGRVWHAWKAGPQTVALRRQLEAMADGGVFAMCIPKAPYRCPPGPYERVSMVAHYFKQAKPRAKVLVLDANPDIVSKKGLFMKAWDDLYKGMIEYRPNSELVEFDGNRMLAKMQLEDVKADVFNIVPPQKAGQIAAPLVNVNNRWVGVEFQGFQTQRAELVHVVGDATSSGPAMPKSAFQANNHGKVAAAAIIARLTGQPVDDTPIFANTCYSFVSATEAMHVASVHKWDAAQKTVVPVPGAGGLSAARSEVEARYALDWATNIWADTLA